MTPEQELALGVDPSSERNTVEGDPYGCQWQIADDTAVLGVAVRLPPIGLESSYTVRDAFEVFEPAVLDGLPVVQAGPDLPGDDTCRLYIGVDHDQMIEASAVGVGPGQGCATARRMAEAMIASLPDPG